MWPSNPRRRLASAIQLLVLSLSLALVVGLALDSGARPADGDQAQQQDHPEPSAAVPLCKTDSAPDCGVEQRREVLEVLVSFAGSGTQVACSVTNNPIVFLERGGPAQCHAARPPPRA